MSVQDTLQHPNTFVYGHVPENVPFVEQDPSIDEYKRPLFYSDMSPQGYSAVDINAFLQPNTAMGIKSPLKFGTLSMLSVSMHRDKFPVSTLGRVGAKGFTCGHRTVAGTLSFNTIHRDAFEGILAATGCSWDTANLHPDELPLFDIQIVMCNEFGEMSTATLQGVTILDSGTAYNLEQVSLSETYSYMALDRTQFTPVNYRRPAMDFSTREYMSTTASGDPGWSGPVLL